VCGKADHYVKEPEINIRVGKALRGDIKFSNPNFITLLLGWIPHQSIFRYSLAICWGGFLTSIACSRPHARALNDGKIIY
jgi:hypothetical protein